MKTYKLFIVISIGLILVNIGIFIGYINSDWLTLNYPLIFVGSFSTVIGILLFIMPLGYFAFRWLIKD